MVRFLHTADIHLDSPLRGLSAYEGAPVDLLRTATRRAFSQLVDMAIEEDVDFVVIAGDLYDGDWRDVNTGLFFVREMGRLNQAEIPVFLVYGNHDAESEITKQLTLPKNVKSFSAEKPETHRLEEIDVALHGQSFRSAATTENLAVGYPDPVTGCLNIGVLHTALEGHAAHATYAPCSLAELQSKGYDYWALGHVHEFAIHSEDPWVVFPGNLQGRHIRELGPRGAVMVSADSDGISLERVFVDVVRWFHVEVDVSEAQTIDDVVTLVGKRFDEVVAGESKDVTIAARVTLTGGTSLHGDLFSLENQLRAEVLSQANAFGEEVLWVEKVRLDTSPQLDRDALKARSDAIADLQDMLDQAADDEAFIEDLADELQQLVNRSPRALFDAVPDLDAVRRGDLGELAKEISPALLSRLASNSEVGSD